MTRRLSSRDNPLLRQLVRIVESSRERRQLGVSFIEGVHLCATYLARVGRPRLTLVTPEAQAQPEVAALLAALAQGSESPSGRAPRQAGAPIEGLPAGTAPVEIAAPLFSLLSQVENGIGVAFLIDTPRAELPERLDEDGVYLDGLQDPGNVGTILRSCAAAGVARVLTAPGTVWCWSPKVLRAGMGAHFGLTLHESVSWPEVLARLSLPVRATSPRAPSTIWQADLRPPALWVFGREGQGLDPDRIAPGLSWIGIPQASAVESLNVAAAVAVCLFEQQRQRQVPSQVGDSAQAQARAPGPPHSA
ncbi:MAG: RNA methyltransferase [Betaproteobacteria bacterium]|nr:RNA methyltransferase [Betaproteobacteria bacterium]